MTGIDDADRFTPPDTEPEVDPDVTVLEVRGEKQVGFKGMKHLEMPEEEKDKIHDVYADIIIELDDIKDEFIGADRAWHIGRVMDEYDVQDNPDMTLEDLGAFNTIEDMYARRLFYGRYIYEFWPDQQYDPRHSITALGELASRATNSDRIEEARNGYERIVTADEKLTKPDVLAWYAVDSDADLVEIVGEVAGRYETPDSIANSVKRVVLLLDRPLNTVSRSELKDCIRNELTS